MSKAMIVLLLAVAVSALAAEPGGNPAKGETVFLRCAQCHTANKGDGNGLGPNLFGVVGRKAALLPSFPYSEPLRNAHIVWSEDMLKKWVAGPQKVVPGTRMSFVGLSNPEDVRNVVAYLRTRR